MLISLSRSSFSKSLKDHHDHLLILNLSICSEVRSLRIWLLYLTPLPVVSPRNFDICVVHQYAWARKRKRCTETQQQPSKEGLQLPEVFYTISSMIKFEFGGDVFPTVFSTILTKEFCKCQPFVLDKLLIVMGVHRVDRKGQKRTRKWIFIKMT